MKSLRDKMTSKLDTTSLDIVIYDAKKVIQKVLDFEQIFNINEETLNIEYDPYKSEDLLSTLSKAIGPELMSKQKISL